MRKFVKIYSGKMSAGLVYSRCELILHVFVEGHKKVSELPIREHGNGRYSSVQGLSVRFIRVSEELGRRR